MKSDGSADHLAVLIDGDNISSKVVAGLMAEVANYGTASVKRIYGDWTSPSMKSWRECLLKYSITPIQQFAYTSGKNATDGSMIIDAMDLLYTGRFSSFCLVTSDSDFTRLAARIREQGVTVYGFGNRHNTHRAFIAACNEFVYLDALPTLMDEPDEPAAAPPVSKDSIRPSHSPPTFRQQHTEGAGQLTFRSSPPAQDTATSPRRPPPSTHPLSLVGMRPTTRPLDQAALDGITQAIESSKVYEQDFANLAEVGAYLMKLSPDLNARNYGYTKMLEFMQASGIVETKMKSRDPAPPIALIRLKDRTSRNM